MHKKIFKLPLVLAAVLTVTLALGAVFALADGDTPPAATEPGIMPVDAAVPTAAFTDVAEDVWYAEYIYQAVKEGLFKGNDDGTFGPDGEITRAQFVLVLYRLSGAPQVTRTAEAAFTDVPEDEYADAIAWAADSGIVTGNGDGTFAPRASISRQDVAAVLYRYLHDYLRKFVVTTEMYFEFTDADEIAAYAAGPIQMFANAGLLRGSTDGAFRPKKPATRAEAAKILVKFTELLAYAEDAEYPQPAPTDAPPEPPLEEPPAELPATSPAEPPAPTEDVPPTPTAAG
jgi:hypothetical protein